MQQQYIPSIIAEGAIEKILIITSTPGNKTKSGPLQLSSSQVTPHVWHVLHHEKEHA
jgi:hypothetical protein